MSAAGARVVALDVDGTVLDHDGTLPAEVRAAVRAVADAGVPVVLSTGRSWHGTLPVVEQLGLTTGPSVCSNGAVIVDFPPERIVKAVTFDPRAVIEKVTAYAPGTLIAVEEIGRGPSSGGKAPILLQVPRDARQLIGVHVGDRQVRGAIVNLAGEVRHREVAALEGRDGAAAPGPRIRGRTGGSSRAWPGPPG